MTVNKVILVGNLGQDPEVRYTATGDGICTLSIATSETRKDKQSGEKKQQTEWHRVILFGELAEIAGKWLKKGSTVYIEGKLRTRKWQDQQGQDKYTTEILADTLRMLGSKSSSSNNDSNVNDNQQTNNSLENNKPASSSNQNSNNEYSREPVKYNQNQPNNTNNNAFDDDDIPF